MKNAFYAIAAATLMLTGCSGELGRDHSKAPVSAEGEIGSLDLKLTTPQGYVINSALYSITGGGLSSPRTSSMDLTNSSQLRFQVGNLPIATGYSIALTATATNGTPCAGTAPFDIANNQVTTLSMNLVCSSANVIETDGNGDIRVSVNVTVDGGITCPVVTGISALPLETAVGSTLQLQGFTSSAGGTVAWSGPGGTFGSASSASTGYTCTAGGDHDLTYTLTVPGCPASAYSVLVTCTGDAGTPPPVDSGVDSGEPPPVDSGTPDTGAPDTGTPDSGQPDSGEPPLSACQQCVRGATSVCRDWFFSGPDNVADCFSNPDPVWVERCVALYRCAVTSADLCAADPTGVTKCYCGATPIETCFTGAATSLPAGNCIAEVNAATQCTTPQCVEGLLNSPERPSYSAYYLTLCTASPDACGPQCTLPRPASL